MAAQAVAVGRDFIDGGEESLFFFKEFTQQGAEAVVEDWEVDRNLIFGLDHLNDQLALVV